MTFFGRNLPFRGGGIRFGRGLTFQAWIIDGRPRVAIHRTSRSGLVWFGSCMTREAT